MGRGLKLWLVLIMYKLTRGRREGIGVQGRTNTQRWRERPWRLVVKLEGADSRGDVASHVGASLLLRLLVPEITASGEPQRVVRALTETATGTHLKRGNRDGLGVFIQSSLRNTQEVIKKHPKIFAVEIMNRTRI